MHRLSEKQVKEQEEMARRVATRAIKRKVEEAKELWLEFFSAALESCMWDAGQGADVRTVEKAVELANAALDKVEERWPE